MLVFYLVKETYAYQGNKAWTGFRPLRGSKTAWDRSGDNSGMGGGRRDCKGYTPTFRPAEGVSWLRQKGNGTAAVEGKGAGPATGRCLLRMPLSSIPPPCLPFAATRRVPTGWRPSYYWQNGNNATCLCLS